MGEKYAKKNFFQKHTDYTSKQRWKKNRLEKVRKHVFFINTRISGPKNGGKKTREKNFPVTHVYRVLKQCKKIVWKSAKSRFI